jgi:arylsulfatase A-like enzyme
MRRGLSLLVLLTTLMIVQARPATPQAPDRPNILVIVTDDQRAGLSVMPETRKRFVRQGVLYSPAFVTTPLCCPSRASIMTGRYAHNHGVKSNFNSGETGADALDHSTTMQRYLQDAGYHTGAIGKFLNQPWRFADQPPHFDEWATTDGRGAPEDTGEEWYDYAFNINGTATYTRGYITTVTRKLAVRFIRRNSGETPWYLYVAPKAPHLPAPPQHSYEDLRVKRWEGNPAVFEKDRSDKPAYVQHVSVGIRHANSVRRIQFRSLVSVDDMVGAIFDELAAQGEDNTLAIFISDNGRHWSEHGLSAKGTPYSQAVNVPMMARWPGQLPQGVKDSRWAANIDIAPTALQAAGVPQDQATPMDGRSLLDPTWQRDRILLEFWCNVGLCNRWASLRTRTDQFVEYYDQGEVVFREYYDLQRDPWQLVNLEGDGVKGNSPPLEPHRQALEEAKRCAGATCP